MATEAAAKPSLTLKRRLKRRPAKVFAAWTDPEKVKRLDGSGRRQGAERRMRRPHRRPISLGDAGARRRNNTTSAASIANSSRTGSWFSAGPGITTPERESLVTVDIKPDGDGSLLTLTHEQFFDADARDRHQGGWNSALDKMEQMFA